MIENDDFINLFFIKKYSFLATCFSRFDLTCLYKNEMILKDHQNELKIDKFKNFLDDNIYKIEKNNNQFVRDINLVIEDEKFLTINLCIKKNILGNLNFKKENLDLISKIKNEIRLNYKEFSIIHILINNYLVDGVDIKIDKNLTSIDCKDFSIEITFILMSSFSILEYQKVFANYQISVNKIVSEEYLRNYSLLEKTNYLDAALKILLGNNPNEVVILTKKVENRGFFEKFFHLFS